MSAPKPTTDPSAFGELLRENALRDPIGRILIAARKLGPNARMSSVAKDAGLSDDEFSAAAAEAEWGGLCKREKRADGIYLILTSQGLARAEVLSK